MTVTSLAPRARRQMRPPPPIHPVTRYALDVVAGRIVAGIYVRKACERHLADLSGAAARGFHFDEAAATKATSFFGLLHHYKGDLGREDHGRGAFVRLEAWQQFVVGAAFGWKRADGKRRFRSVYLEVAKKNGKALGLETPLPTPSGWTTMGDIREGDRLFDEHGRPCTVTFATDIMEGHDCYRVEFSDGSAVVADRDHLWQTITRRGPGSRDKRKAAGEVRTTAEIAATLDGWPSKKTRYRNHRIPVAGPLVLPTADLPVDPYVLGVWLGDGDSRSAVVTVGATDRELVGHLVAAGVSVAQRPVQAPRAERYTLRDGAGRLGVTLRGLRVLGDKHIPMPYLRASLEQRTALLQGLMDTDGSISAKGQCEFTVTRKRLVDGMVELLRSLGFKPSVHESRATIYGRDIGPRWRVTFNPLAERPVFRLKRKLTRQRAAVTMARRSLVRHITAVVPVPSAPVRCIQVDSVSHLFLAGESMVPTHNTLLGAGIALLLTFFDGEPGAEFYSLATKEDQAKLSWNDGAQFVAKNAAIGLRVRKIGKRLVDDRTASFWMPLGRDSDVGDQGINAQGGLVDELHVLDSRDPIDNLETATSARSQPMIWKLTTAGVKRESVWAEERADAISILEGRATDDSVLALVFTLDEGDDPFDEAVWPKSNPNLNVSVMIDTLREQAEKAKRSPGKLAAFLRFRMNVPTSVSTRALDISEWDANAGELDGRGWAEQDIPVGSAGYAGLDLASVKDLTAFIAVFKSDDGYYDVLCRFWCPEDGIADRSRRDAVPYADWVRDGYLVATPGNVTDYAFIREEIKQLSAIYLLSEVGYDKWNATQLVTELEQDGATCVPIPQTHAGLGPAWRELEKLVLEHRLRHGNHPILRWMAGNVEVETDAVGNQKPSKRLSAERIDGMVALDMALSRHMTQGEVGIWTAA